jgi:hypothetical protein
MPLQPVQNKEQAIKDKTKTSLGLCLLSLCSTAKSGFTGNIAFPSDVEIWGPRVQVRNPTLIREPETRQIP